MDSRVACFVGVFALATAGCAGTSSTSGPPQSAANGASVLTQDGKVASVPYAAEGTTFDARVNQPLDTRLSSPGQRISATLIQPIKGSNGKVLIAAGAQLEGKVAAIERVNGPHIVLEFDTLRTRNGTVPVGVRVLSAQQERYRTLPANTGVTSMQPSEGGAGEGEHGTSQISIPQGAVVQLALTRPIIEGANLK